MPFKMNRGKNQIMYNYLPGYVFDFDKSNIIAQIDSIRGTQRIDLNLHLILEAVKSQASAWGNLAPVLANPTTDQFVLLEPRKVFAQLFPKVFWCQNQRCGRVFDYNQSDTIPHDAKCSICKKGNLVQLRFVKIHQCGAIHPLTPPYTCKKCKAKNQFSLDTRNSERISQFTWICRKCNERASLFAGNCRACNWEVVSGDSDKTKKRMSIEVHRASRVFYPHYVVLLNQPGADINNFLGINQWEIIASGFFMGLSELAGKTVKTFTDEQLGSKQDALNVSNAEIAQFKAQGYTDDQIKLLQQMQADLKGSRQQQQSSVSPANISQILKQQTGVSEKVWQFAGRELLEAVLPFQSDQTQDLFVLSTPNSNQCKAQTLALNMGLAKLSLASDFPMTHVTFGYSRAEYTPGKCQLNSFPADSEYQGKFPLFVDSIQADAIIVSLDPQRVWQWLLKNNFNISLPSGATDAHKAQQAYFVKLISDLALLPDPVTLTQTLTANHPEARMVFGLLHSMSHLFLKKAALLCGLDRTSLAEYVLPRALTFAIYCNHRFGATIGALSSLFEQSLPEWLDQIKMDTQRCIYDPVCQTKGGNCHACTHLSETSCRFFNLNLGRSFLFGGYDKELGDIDYGYWDSTLNQINSSQL